MIFSDTKTGVFAKTTQKIPQKSSKSCRTLSGGLPLMIRKQPISERFTAPEFACARLNGGFAMRGLRLARLIALTPFLLLLLTPSAALADPTGATGGTDMPVPNVETAGPPASASGDVPGPSPTAIVAPGVPSQPVTEPSTAVDPDAAITEQLHNLANGKFDPIIGSTKERESIDAFYASRNYAPLWITEGKANARAKAAIAYLGSVSADGLDPTDYPVPNFASLTQPAALAEAEIRLTTSVITYARHAQIGRVHWSRVSGDIFYDQSVPDPNKVLATMAEAKDASEALDAYEPHAEAYLALKVKLAELLRGGQRGSDRARIANGPPLKIGMRDERVPPLRSRLDVASDGGPTYDKVLADAVKKFQETHALKATGMLDAATLEALNGHQSDRRTDIIIANLERWRWMPHDLGATYVIVNLPDFTLRVMRQGKLVWMTKLVVGKPGTPTPIMTAQMKSITVNPTWNVPDSIAANEYLPLLQQDPTILQRMGLQVSYNADGSIHLSQPPGEQNALGQLRFNFPNKFLVYQHDSNQKYLFANNKRADSHGCMRVQDPVKYAEVLLSMVRPGEGYTQDRIRRMFGAYENDIQFPTFIPVHLTYQTAFVDDQGKLELREDIYGRDQALLAILNGAERKVADIPIQRKDNTMRRQLLAIPDNFWGGWGRGFGGGLNFFTQLFGGPYTRTTPVPRRPAAQHRAYYQ
jgi:murein L,D-transpeptidase YcbB/YkuD